MEGDGRGEQSAHLVAIDRVAPAGVTRVAIARSVFFCVLSDKWISLYLQWALAAWCTCQGARATRDTYWTLVVRGLPLTEPYWWRGVLFPAATHGGDRTTLVSGLKSEIIPFRAHDWAVAGHRANVGTTMVRKSL